MLWLSFACNSAPEKESAPEEVVVRQEIEAVEHPVIEIVVPQRGEFIVDNGIDIQGVFQSGSAPISGLTLNREEISLGEDSFSSAVQGRPGVNILNFRLEAEDRGRAVDSVGVYHGPYQNKEELVASGVRLQLTQELLDDGEPDIDDLASIAEEVVNNLDITALLGDGPIAVDEYQLTLNEVTHGGVDLSIDCGDTLLVTAELSDVYIDAYIDIWSGFDGTITVEDVFLELELQFYVEDGEVVVYVVDRTVEFASIESDDWLPWGFGWLEPIIINSVQEQVETALGEQVESLVEGLVTDYINSFALDLELLAGVNLRAQVANIGVADDGLRMEMDAGFQGDFIKEIPAGVGSAKFASVAPYWPLTTTRPFAAGISGDLLNQLVFAIWGTGYFDGIEIDGVLIQGISGGVIPEPIGPVEKLDINIGLPPSLHSTELENMTAALAMGEWQMNFTREDGEVIDFRINLEAGIDVYSENGKIKLDVDDRPAKISLGVATLQGPESLDKGDLSALGRLMIPSLLGSITTFLPSFELPPIPLSSFEESLPDLQIHGADITMTSNSWLLIEAEVE